MSRSNAHFQHWCETAGETAETWAATPAVQAVLAKVYMLEGWANDAIGIARLVDAIGEELSELECDLDNARSDALAEAWAQHPSNDDDAQYELDEAAPTVATATAVYRKIARQRELDECFPPVRWIAPGSVAA